MIKVPFSDYDRKELSMLITMGFKQIEEAEIKNIHSGDPDKIYLGQSLRSFMILCAAKHYLETTE